MLNPILFTDAYKLGHIKQYPTGTEKVVTNITARGTRIPDITHTVSIGAQFLVLDFFEDQMNRGFFNRDLNDVLFDYHIFLDSVLGPDNGIGTNHIEELWEYGKIPLKIRTLPEGSRVPLRVPFMLIENTEPQFFWVTNYFETVISNYIWKTITSATQAYRLRQTLDKYADIAGMPPESVNFRAHDFSMRGMSSIQDAAMSGMGHLLSFTGSDSLPAIDLLNRYYGPNDDIIVGGSVPATEHSVMCAGGELEERETFRRLICNVQPNGFISIVSDTWDYFNALDVIVRSLKDEIMDRDGTTVIRPDSGDPVKIICGDPDATDELVRKGSFEILWDIFGGTINEKGLRVLDSHIGLIYGDSITHERADLIDSTLIKNGFAPTEVLGVGSYTYQYVTRDTFGIAMKATYCEINGEPHNIFKRPKTDDGIKNSAKGLLAVYEQDGDYVLKEEATWDEVNNCAWVTIFDEGFIEESRTNLTEMRARLGAVV